MNSKKKPAVFLDRDGTINVDYGYVYQKEKLEFIDGTFKALRMLQKAGYLLIIVTNQSGVARGYFSINELEEFHKYMLSILDNNGINIDKIYYCPHLKGCDCRKPKLQMYYRAAEDFDVDFSKSYAIGDKMSDLAICKSEPVKGYLISLSQNDEIEKGEAEIKICKSVLEATIDILGNSKMRN